MSVQINGNKTITFTPQGISYVLDMLANCPWKLANPLINDIMGQLKQQEGKADGSTTLGDLASAASGGNASSSSGRIPPVEAQSPNDGPQGIN